MALNWVKLDNARNFEPLNQADKTTVRTSDDSDVRVKYKETEIGAKGKVWLTEERVRRSSGYQLSGKQTNTFRCSYSSFSSVTRPKRPKQTLTHSPSLSSISSPRNSSSHPSGRGLRTTS